MRSGRACDAHVPPMRGSFAIQGRDRLRRLNHSRSPEVWIPPTALSLALRAASRARRARICGLGAVHVDTHREVPSDAKGRLAARARQRADCWGFKDESIRTNAVFERVGTRKGADGRRPSAISQYEVPASGSQVRPDFTSGSSVDRPTDRDLSGRRRSREASTATARPKAVRKIPARRRRATPALS